MNELPNNITASEIEIRTAYAEDALRSGGELYDIAQSTLETPVALTPREAGNVLLPPKQPTEEKKPRWQLIEGARESVKTGAAKEQGRILERAKILGMRQPESLTLENLERVHPEAAIWVIEGGANRTSVVRRQLAIEAVEAVYGMVAIEQTIYHFGSERPILRELQTKNGKVPNPEYKIATEIAGDFLPDSDSLTEFGLNLASAQQAGYQIVGQDTGSQAAERSVALHKEGSPRLVLVQPYSGKDGLKAAFTALEQMGEVAGRQFVISTNGQYRPKDELQASQWAQSRSKDMLPPVAVGDEPGYSIVHNGQEITTANRAAMAYLNEIIVLERLS